MASRNVEAHRTAHENWSQRDFDAVVSEMAENFTYQDHARGLRIGTRDGFKDYVAGWAESFSDTPSVLVPQRVAVLAVAGLQGPIRGRRPIASLPACATTIRPPTA
jgi:hypothetical protein